MPTSRPVEIGPRKTRAQNVQELLATAHLGSRPSVLDPFTDHLHQRWNEGCTNATRLFAEIRDTAVRRDPSAGLSRHPRHAA